MKIQRYRCVRGKMFLDPDGDYVKYDDYMKVDDTSPLRSNAQNDRYWAIVTKIAEESGDTPMYMHDRLREKFLSKEVEGSMGTRVVLRSTSTLSVKQMVEYTDDVTRFAFEFYNLILE